MPFHAGETLALEVRRLVQPRRVPLGADHRAEMFFEPLVAFAGAALEPGAVGDLDGAAAGGDQAFR